MTMRTNYLLFLVIMLGIFPLSHTQASDSISNKSQYRPEKVLTTVSI